MTDWTTREGGCRCGKVRIRMSAPPLITAACHCTGCQKMSSSAYSLSAAIPATGFEVIQGEPVIGGLHGPQAHHFFCGHCMTWMFTRGEGMDWFVNVRPTMLDDTGWFRPFLETFTNEKLAFAETGAVKSYERFPEMEEYEGLVRAYAEWVVGNAAGRAPASPLHQLAERGRAGAKCLSLATQAALTARVFLARRCCQCQSLPRSRTCYECI